MEEEENEKGADKKRIQRNEENTRNMRKRMVRKRRREIEENEVRTKR